MVEVSGTLGQCCGKEADRQQGAFLSRALSSNVNPLLGPKSIVRRPNTSNAFKLFPQALQRYCSKILVVLTLQ